MQNRPTLCVVQQNKSQKKVCNLDVILQSIADHFLQRQSLRQCETKEMLKMSCTLSRNFTSEIGNHLEKFNVTI